MGGVARVDGDPKGTASRLILAIGDDFLGVRLLETVDETRPLTDPMRLTGKLALYIDGDNAQQFRRRWWDTKSQRLERLLEPFTETLANALAAKKQTRLDAECVDRQRKQVERIRKQLSRDASREFYLRQELMQNVNRWTDAQRVREYLAALKSAVDAGHFRPANEQNFAAWFEWASQFADSIDPVIGGPLPEGRLAERQNIACSELDLTATTRRVVNKLGATDTDALWKLNQDAVRACCEGKFGPVWNEITRVLEALGYDVSKRGNASEWW